MPDSQLVAAIDRLVAPDVQNQTVTPDLRVRHVLKDGIHYYLLFNEGSEDLHVHCMLSAKGNRMLLNPATAESQALTANRPIQLSRHAMQILAVIP